MSNEEFPEVTPQKLSEQRQDAYAKTVKGKYVTGDVVKAVEETAPVEK